MNLLVTSLSFLSVWCPQVQQFDARAVARTVSDQVPDRPTVLLEDYPAVDQYKVARELFEQGRRLRDATLTLVVSRNPLRQNPDDEAEEILQSLGPKLRGEVAPVFVEWLSGDTDHRRFVAWFALQNIDRLPDSQIPVLRKLTSNSSAGLRRQAATLLGSCGERANEAMPELKKLLSDALPSVQVAACEAIMQVAPSSQEPLPALLRAAAAYDEKQAVAALEMLSTATGALDHEAKIRDAFDRVRMRSEVSNFAWHAPPDRVAVLAKWLLDEKSTPPFRLEILKSFRGVNGDASAARGAVVKVVREFGKDYRASAIRALSYIGGFDAEAIRPKADDGPLERQAIARALSACSTDSAPAARSLLLSLLKDDAKGVQFAACVSLCRRGDVPGEAAEFLDRMLTEGSVRDQVKAISLVPLLGPDSKPLVPALMKIMDEGKIMGFAFGHAELNSLSSRALGEIGEPAIPELLKGLRHDNPNVRALSARSLGAIGSAAAVDPLFKSLQAERDRFRNEQTLQAILLAIADTIEGDADADSRVEDFVKLLDVEWARSGAIRALGSIGRPARRVVPTLLKLKGIEFASDTGFELARALSKLSPEGSIGLLGIRRALKAVSEKRSYSSFEHFGLADTVDLIVELGERARPLIPELAFMVEEHEFLHREHRMQAAYALARLEPNNAKWREHIERWAAMDIVINPAETRLLQLREAAE